MSQPKAFISEGISIADTLHRALTVYSDRDLFGVIDRSTSPASIRYLSSGEVLNTCLRLACSLKNVVGLVPKQHVGICALNHPRWLLADFGLTFSSNVAVGLLPEWPLLDMSFVISDAELGAIFCDTATFPKISQALSMRENNVRHLILLDGTEDQLALMQQTSGSHITLHNLDALAKKALHRSHTCSNNSLTPYHGVPRGLGSSDSTSEDETELFTLIFSSGTSGTPKGIMIPKKRWKLDQMSGAAGAYNPSVTTVHQALAHGCDRGICWQSALAGGKVVFVRGEYSQFIEDLQIVRPTYLTAMSFTWTKLYVEAQQELNDAAFSLLTEKAKQYIDPSLIDTLSSSRTHPEVQKLIQAVIKDPATGSMLLAKCYSATRQKVGGRLDLAVTGGSSTSKEVLDFLLAALERPDSDESPSSSVQVINAYGSTEFPGISQNGEISDLVELKLVDVPDLGYSSRDQPFPRGEIWVRNKLGITAKYWHRPDENEKAFKEGYYATGDIGSLDYSRKLTLLDRRSNFIELYVQGRSVWVPFATLEDSIYAPLDCVQQILLFGDRMQEVVLACIVPRAAHLQRFAQTMGLSQEEAIQRPEYKKFILNALAAAAKLHNRERYEVPADIHLELQPWSVDNGLLSSVGKPKRFKITEKYRPVFDEMYAHLLESAKQPLALSPPVRQTSDYDDGVLALCISLKEALVHAQVLSTNKSMPRPTKPKLISSSAPLSNDFLDFQFDFDKLSPPPHPNAVADLNSCLAEAKKHCAHLRNHLNAWKQEKKLRDIGSLNAVRSTVRMFSERISKKNALVIEELKECVLLMETHESADLLSAESRLQQCLASLEAFSGLCMERLSQVYQKIARSKAIRAEDHPDLVKAQNALHVSVRQHLVALAEALGLAVPYQIFSGLWAVPLYDKTTFDATDLNRGTGEGGLGSSIGDEVVYCDRCAATIEGDDVPSGVDRMHSLDTAKIDRCMGCHASLSLMEELISSLLRVTPVSSKIHSLICSWRDSYNPHRADFYSKEDRLIYWIQDIVKKTNVNDDSPASMIWNAFSGYKDRLALGFPDPEEVPFSEDSMERATQCSPLCEAAGLSPILHNKFRWVTYQQLGLLTERVAKGLLSLPGMKVGSRVGLCGYNTVEWSTCDFACAVAGLISVGIHVTFPTETAKFVMNDADLLTLCVHSDKFPWPGPSSHHNITTLEGYFTLREIISASPNLLNVVVMDKSQSEIAYAIPDPLNFFGRSINLVSLLDFVAEPSCQAYSRTQLMDLSSSQSVSSDSPFTIFYTSGSENSYPKGVVASSQGFLRDARERVFAVPLITQSYIPLSHTSDRMKLWEFLGNGGRVGFCYYDASNWREHETTKKSHLLQPQSSGHELHLSHLKETQASSFNNVVALFAQVKPLSPVAVACPPRIWSGLYSHYQSLVHGGHSEVSARLQIASMFGDRLKSIFTGGAPTAPYLVSFIKSCFPFTPLHDSYGATECGAITEDGVPLSSKGVEVALLDLPELGFLNSNVPPRGEIIVKTPNMTLGYLNNPSLTAQVYLPGGWYRTGDLGSLEEGWQEGNRVTVKLHDGSSRAATVYTKAKFKILERVSAVKSLKSGEIIYPSYLEGVFEKCPYLSQVYVHVSPRNMGIGCLVTLSDVGFSAWGQEAASVIEKRALLELNRIGIAENLRSHEIPRSLKIVPGFSVANQTLNGQLKKVRKRIEAIHAPQLAEVDLELDRFCNAPVAKCCLTHEVIYNPEAAENENYEDFIRQLKENSSGSRWAVLVAGEAKGIMSQDKAKTREGKYLGSHCSLENIGRLYDALVDYLGPERIIVIAQLRETLEWLEEATASDENCARMAGAVKLRPLLTQKLESTRLHCKKLIENGGADYDFSEVNPATVVRVLTGVSLGGKKVIPQTGCDSLFLALNSHGNCHSVNQEKLSSLKNHNEWYFLMPYSSDEESLGMYDFVSYKGYDPDNEESHTHLLYGQLLFSAFHQMLSLSPYRKIIGLFQFCLSQGLVRFLEHDAFHKYYNTNKWPVGIMVTSGKFESSLGDFLIIWTEMLKKELQRQREASRLKSPSSNSSKPSGPATRSRSANSSSLSSAEMPQPKTPSKSLMDLYKMAETHYWKINSGVKAMNSDIQLRLKPSEAEQMTFGQLAFLEGDAVSSLSLADLFLNSDHDLQ